MSGGSLLSSNESALREPVNGRSAEQRAGSTVLSLFVPPLTLPILRALDSGPMRLTPLREAVGLPAQTTLRGHLAGLVEIGAIAKVVRADGQVGMDYELTAMGRDLLVVAESLEVWLSLAPDAAIAMTSSRAKGAMRALVDGWGSQMIGALAARPLPLTELDMLISDLNYPAIERRLASMRMAGLVEADPRVRGRTPYGLTDWGRRAIVPLSRAIRCERIHLPRQSTALTPADVEAAFLLALPLAVLPVATAGWCQLRVESRAEGGEEAGVRVDVEAGQIVSCVPDLDPEPRNWAGGSAGRWFEAVDSGDPARLRLGGGQRLAKSVVRGMHEALVGNDRRR